MSDLAWMRPKLAELCGLRLSASDIAFRLLSQEADEWDQVGLWRPDEDVAQAIRCLEALRSKGRHWSLGTTSPEDFFIAIAMDDDEVAHTVTSDTLPAAICLAIAAAMEWKEP